MVLAQENITHIINTANGLGNFFPKFKSYESANRDRGVKVLELRWCDDRTQVLSEGTCPLLLKCTLVRRGFWCKQLAKQHKGHGASQ